MSYAVDVDDDDDADDDNGNADYINDEEREVVRGVTGARVSMVTSKR